jgi:hydrogenase nickel incorporation protein HypB
MTLDLEQQVLAKNDRLADVTRRWLAERNILALNLVGAPGSGKTTFLERTVREFGATFPVAVIEGDQDTPADAERIRAAGCAAVQINTGSGCHLDAAMVKVALDELAPRSDSLVFIENVCNLVCPALFDLGERAKVVILSTTEGENKPLKYPHMFRAARLMIVNKIDLLPHLCFDVARCVECAHTVNPQLEVLQVSAVTGTGFGAWYAWLRSPMSADAPQGAVSVSSYSGNAA